MKERIGRWLFGRRLLQPAFEKLSELALAGMNIGGGGDVAESGERWVLDLLARRRRALGGRPLVVFDVGANKGQYARLVLDRLGDGVELHCFEPAPGAWAELQAKLSGDRRVTLENVGLSNAEGAATLHADADGSGLASVYKRRLDHFGIAFEEKREVRLRRLDEVCRERGVRHIDLLKLDVEGHELRALEGAGELLSSGAIDLVQFEFGGCNIDSRTYLQDFFYLLTPRYRLHRLVKDGIVPVDAYRERYECFITTNFVALRRGLEP
jgi:FkbM family methyltransferase